MESGLQGMPRELLFNLVASFSYAHLLTIDETSRETSLGLAASELHSVMWTKKRTHGFAIQTADGQATSYRTR